MADPAGSARAVISEWAQQFDRLLLHLDLDVLDYLDMPLAENYRRNRGLRFEQLTSALSSFLQAPNWTALTMTELNPDHCDAESLHYLVDRLAYLLSKAPTLRRG